MMTTIACPSTTLTTTTAKVATIFSIKLLGWIFSEAPEPTTTSSESSSSGPAEATRDHQSASRVLKNCPTAGKIFLRSEDGHTFLANAMTQELVELSGKEWVLYDAASGFSYLTESGGPPTWAHKFFKRVAQVDQHGSLWITGCSHSDDPVLASTVQQLKKELTVSLVCERADTQFNALLFEYPDHGAQVWWSANDLHTQLKLSSARTPSRWINKSWDRWLRYVLTFGLDPVHMQRSAITRNSSVTAADTKRVADFHVVSTHALILLCVRWISLPREQGGLEADGDVAMVRAFLNSVFSSLLEPCSVTLYASGASHWTPPLMPTGKNPVRVRLQTYRMEISDLMKQLAESCPHLHSILLPKLPDSQVCDLATLISKLATFHDDDIASNLLRQLVIQIGCAIDRGLQNRVSTMAEDGVEFDGVVSIARLTSNSSAQRDKFLYKYWMKSREIFNQPKVVSMSVDASNVHDAAIMIGPLAKPSGEAMWMPPQVPDSYTRCPQRPLRQSGFTSL